MTIRNEVTEVLNQSRHFQLLPPSGLPTRLNEENRMVLSGIYGAQSLRQVEQCVGEIEEAIGVILGDIYYINIVTHILIAMERMRRRRYINPGGVMNPKLINCLLYTSYPFSQERSLKHNVSPFIQKPETGIKETGWE